MSAGNDNIGSQIAQHGKSEHNVCLSFGAIFSIHALSGRYHDYHH